MSRSLVQGSSQSLTNAAQVLSAPPFTFAAWVNFVTNNSQQSIISLNTAGTNTFELTLDSGGHLVTREFDNTTLAASGSAGIPTTGSWHHCAGTSSGHSNRTSYLDGSAGTTDTTTVGATVTNTGIGTSLGGNFLNAAIAFAAIWNVVLSLADIVNLSSGINPLTYRPDALVAYWPLWGDDSPEPDWNPSGTLKALTLNNAPTKGSSNPPVVPYNFTTASGIMTNVSGAVYRRTLSLYGARVGSRQNY